MSVGFPQDKVTIDQRVGALAFNLRATFDQIQTVKAWLDSKTDADLGTSGGVGYTAAEIATLRAAFTDMDNLRKIAHAQATQPAANDFFFNAKNLVGVQ